MNTVTLPINIVNQILAHAQYQSEEEVCGLMAEQAGQIKTVYPIQNISAEPQSLYRMDAKAQIDAMRRMREKGERLYAIYHSHPNSAAYPSITDVNEAQYPNVVYLIISLSTEGVLDLCGYRLKDREIETLEVLVS